MYSIAEETNTVQTRPFEARFWCLTVVIIYFVCLYIKVLIREHFFRLKTKSCLSRKAEHGFSFDIQILKKNMQAQEK